ncbi:HAD family phosphatase [Psychroserpens sp. SPM9]|uniref:HAD family hydrolase n=1 Tax=Psychroserpens sp. SPM9 TaxID=2975598 RepID=UPI0021A7F5FE|nr:HAD family hydrolase [Psychroserpens sp. SPM9]MDG5492298.1 HAD family hydrolase [Psychroserpens sp. SPM9]
MSKFKCVIFDCDGVLVDSEPIGNQVMVDLANRLGASIDLEYAYQHFKGYALDGCVQKISELIGKEVPSDFKSTYRSLSYERFQKEIQPIDGVLEVVKRLDIPFCVASSGPESKIKLNLELTGLLPYFEKHIFSCYTIQKWKPDPAVFIWASETMGFQPHECLVVEDSLTGVKAAKSGGFAVAGYTAHDVKNELGSEIDYNLKSMQQLLTIV